MTKGFTWRGTGVSLVLFGALMTLAGCAVQAPSVTAVDEQQIERASSPMDHAQIASRYESQAARDAAAAKRHLGFAAIYRKNASESGTTQDHLPLALHCENLAKMYQQAADDNLALARLHREMAAKAR